MGNCLTGVGRRKKYKRQSRDTVTIPGARRRIGSSEVFRTQSLRGESSLQAVFRHLRRGTDQVLLAPLRGVGWLVLQVWKKAGSRTLAGAGKQGRRALLPFCSPLSFRVSYGQKLIGGKSGRRGSPAQSGEGWFES